MCLLLCSHVVAAPAKTKSAQNLFAPMTINHLRCENVLNPMGIEVPQPRLSWQLASNARGERQATYRILVASTPQMLAQNRGDLWDSGQVRSDTTTHVVYSGKTLTSDTRCYWKVRVWNAGGKTSSESAPAFWQMGLLHPSDWRGQWIGYEAPQAAGETDTTPTLQSANWIWYPEGNPASSAPIATRWFRRTFSVPVGRALQSALLRVAADNSATVFLNGREVGRAKDSWKTRSIFDVKNALVTGANTLAIAVANEADTAANAPNPAGVAVELNARFADGAPLSVVTNGNWKTSDQLSEGWQSGAFVDANWKPAQVLAKVGEGPWGAVATGSIITAPPAPYLRRTFALNGKIKRATAYICGLGLYEMSLNGRKVGDHVLDPAWTQYDRRSLYVAHDVTPYLKSGRNALGVILGTGHFDDHVLSVWDFDSASWRARPKMKLELRVDYEDGRKQTIVSDGNWKASTGPITFDSISGGEHFDARLEKSGWDTANYQETDWLPAQVVEPVKGVLVAQIAPAIKVTEIVDSVKVSEPKPGVWVFDLGQNLAGVPQLRVTGAAGTKIVMRCGEKLYPDGTLDLSNIDTFVKRRDQSQDFQTDSYTLKGDGQEVWNPRFTYHGFQYVEVTGFPGRPTPENLRALVMHSAFETAGTFQSSNDLLNHTQRNTLWSYRNNWHGLPTDCPTREKNGWTGDAHLAAEMGLYNFDGAANYEKWLNDVSDAQRPSGELPGIVPTSGWGFNIGPSWDSAYPLIVWYLYQYRDDRRVIEKHYDGLGRYMNYVSTRAKDGIVDYGLGDWLPAKTQTPNALTSTGYYYADARILAQMAQVLGKTEDAARYSALAESIKTAFNAKFYNPQTHQYANGSITAQSCALFQGLVDEANKPAVLQALIDEIERQDYHMDVGILGAKYVLNTLADNGRADVAYRMLQVRTFPSYGYWIDRGATTLWERWSDVGNQDDSRDHVMFGDVSAWFYKYLAGIRMGSVGFKTIVLQPHVLGDLTSARATHDSVHGRIESDWKIENQVFRWKVSVPANTSATVMVPCESKDQTAITESGQPIGKVAGIRALPPEKGYAVFAVGSGNYNFACPSGSTP